MRRPKNTQAARPEASESHGQGGRAGAVLGFDNLVTTELDAYTNISNT
jgi:hypothetical protein